MPLGPVQIVVIGFPHAGALEDFGAEVAAIHAAPGVRLIDILSVSKDESGHIDILEVDSMPDLDGGEPGALVTALTGIEAGDPDAEQTLEGTGLTEEDIWFVDDVIPPGTSATLALIEHTWAAGLREHIQDAGGALVAEAWIHPSDLESAGL